MELVILTSLREIVKARASTVLQVAKAEEAMAKSAKIMSDIDQDAKRTSMDAVQTISKMVQRPQ